VCCLLFVVPLLRRLSGRRDVALETESAVLGRDLPANDERTDYLRAACQKNDAGIMVATPFGNQDSSVMSRLAAANCLVLRPPFAPAAKMGEACSVVKLAF
jgi:molybdopterin molybdotransferase